MPECPSLQAKPSRNLQTGLTVCFRADTFPSPCPPPRTPSHAGGTQRRDAGPPARRGGRVPGRAGLRRDHDHRRRRAQGVSRAPQLHHFATRADLVGAAVQHVFAQAHRRTTAGFARVAASRDRVRRDRGCCGRSTCSRHARGTRPLPRRAPTPSCARSSHRSRRDTVRTCSPLARAYFPRRAAAALRGRDRPRARDHARHGPDAQPARRAPAARAVLAEIERLARRARDARRSPRPSHALRVARRGLRKAGHGNRPRSSCCRSRFLRAVDAARGVGRTARLEGAVHGSRHRASLTMGVGNVLINAAIGGMVLGLRRRAPRRAVRLSGSAGRRSSPASSPGPRSTTGSTGVARAALVLASHASLHHSSQRYNLSTALRQTWTGKTTLGFVFWLPLSSSAEPSMVHSSWRRTCCTSSGSTPRRSTACPPRSSWCSTRRATTACTTARTRATSTRTTRASLIIWDRLFGTFTPRARRRAGPLRPRQEHRDLQPAAHRLPRVDRDRAGRAARGLVARALDVPLRTSGLGRTARNRRVP